MHNVSELLASLTRTITYPSNRICRASADEVLPILARHFAAEVTRRGRKLDIYGPAKVIEQIAGWLTSDNGKPWLVLSGTPGTGKSTAMAAIRNTLREYCVSAKQFNSSDFPVLFLENVELTERQILGGDWCRVLLLDDVGVEQTEIKEYGNIIQPFVKIVEERYNRCLPLVLSTNLNGNEFMQRYGLRTADRLREMAMTIKYEGKSYRV